MRKLFAILPICLTVGVAGTAFGWDPARDMRDEIEQTEKAAAALSEIMNVPDRAIPRDILANADCVAVFPKVIKAAFGIGGRGGRGVAVCRGPQGWSAPAFLKLGGGSIGAQIGVEATDYVMLFMTPESARHLLSNKVKLGADIGVAAGPVGREAGAATDIALRSQILTYSRSKGLFAGVSLEGAVMETDDDDMRAAYGPNVTTRDVLFGGMRPPAGLDALSRTLIQYSPGVGTSGTRP